MKLQVYQVDAFTDRKFAGNPAGVVSNADGLTDAQMQALARELNNSETAFLLSPTAPDHEVRIRFFTPMVEVPVCGHATISAHFVRATEMDLPSCTVIHKIGIGILPVEIIREGNTYKVVMTQGAVEFLPPLVQAAQNAIVAALGLSEHDLDQRCPIQIVSTGHSKVMIGLKDRTTVNSLRPDMNRLTELSKTIGCNGYFAFAIGSDPEVLAHGRMFAPAIGVFEDPVTGNANGPLGAYLVKHKLINIRDGIFTFKARQGEAMGRPGIVEVKVDVKNGDPVWVKVGGNAIIVFKTEIEI